MELSVSVWDESIKKSGVWMTHKRGKPNIINPETIADFEDEFHCKRKDAGKITDRFVFESEIYYNWFLLKWKNTKYQQIIKSASEQELGL